MDIEVKRMSPTAVEMLDQLSAVCKRFGVDYYAASQNQRDLLDSIALHEYQLNIPPRKHVQNPEPFQGQRLKKGSGFLFGWDALRRAGLFIFWYILPCRARRGRSIPSG